MRQTTDAFYHTASDRCGDLEPQADRPVQSKSDRPDMQAFAPSDHSVEFGGTRSFGYLPRTIQEANDFGARQNLPDLSLRNRPRQLELKPAGSTPTRSCTEDRKSHRVCCAVAR
jgi:hypothetical protein